VSPTRTAPGLLSGRLFLELHQQRLDGAQPVVAVVDRSGLPGRRGRVGLGRVAGSVRALLAKDIDEHIDLAGGKANADVVGRPRPDHLHDSSSRGPRRRPRLLDRCTALL